MKYNLKEFNADFPDDAQAVLAEWFKE